MVIMVIFLQMTIMTAPQMAMKMVIYDVYWKIELNVDHRSKNKIDYCIRTKIHLEYTQPCTIQ